MTSNPVAAQAEPTIEDVWRRFGREIRSFVGRRVSDPHHADDIVGEILLRVHRSLHTLDDSDRLAAWLFRIARNAIIDHYRRTSDKRELLEALPGDRLANDVTEFDDDYSVHRDLAACLQPMLDQLSPEYRRALQLTDLDGATQAVAAELEGITLPGMKSRVQRARKQLAELLNRCCTLTLDARGMPMDYTPSAQCAPANSPRAGCQCQ
ncbi:sigma-70 family RNA polymerase sigma factor [Mycobacterium hubeiense]|uniref:sigma-70 family RNA polymerase sigma factor n=1 Tax=Mycobacterium hubeiense TaxID=1867256 RepID=UPI000C7E9DF0|nr:sigma-70 family RNA polymerase sigma factor [Mycobacterium sp. QGD 101]